MGYFNRIETCSCSWLYCRCLLC